MNELLTTKELAELLRLNEKKIYQLVRDTGVPHVRIAGKWLFPREHVMRWLDERVQRERDVLMVGSDDILMGRLCGLYSQDNFPEALVFYSAVGSGNGLKALSRRKGHACCTHLLDVESGDYNLPFVRRYLADQEYAVVHLWHRSQGLILKRENPLGLKGFQDVIRKKVRFVNRNEGSGTRVLVDYLIDKTGLNVRDIQGYDTTVTTHLDVGLKVFFDDADVGVGIEYVTHLLPLSFVPLQEERFDLVVPKDLWNTHIIQGLISYIDPARIRRLSTTLPGYSFRDTGNVVFSS